MKYVQPIIEYSQCDCPFDTIRFAMDKYGVTDMFCAIHGPSMMVGKIEFDSKEKYEAWLHEQDWSI